MHEGKTNASCSEEITSTTELASQTQYYGGVRYRKNTTLPFEKVTPLDGYTNFGGMYDQSNGP
jgi:hypothetical protein